MGHLGSSLTLNGTAQCCIYAKSLPANSGVCEGNRILFTVSFGYAIRSSDTCRFERPISCGLALGSALRNLDAIALGSLPIKVQVTRPC